MRLIKGLRPDHRKLLQKYAPWLLDEEEQWLKELRVELENIKARKAADRFHKRYKTPSQKDWLKMSNWMIEQGLFVLKNWTYYAYIIKAAKACGVPLVKRK